MLVMAPTFEPASKHVPAWKKIGLKLKYAKEDPEGLDENHIKETPGGTKRKSSSDVDSAFVVATTERPTKKLKKPKSHPKDEVTVKNDAQSASSHEGRKPSPVAIQTTPSTKRKSVSFAPEAKIEDGEGIKQVYRKWVEEQLAIDPSFDPSSVSPALKSVMPSTVRSSSLQSDSLTPHPTSTAEAKKSKKPKVKQKSTSKQAKPSPSSSYTQPEHPALIYLKTYHTDLPNWKFSKPQQNHLLKHLFSFSHIHSSYDIALLGYLKGLKGIPARSRIRAEAFTVREDDEKWLDTDPSDSEKMDQETHAECKARRKRDYDAAVARMKAELRAKEYEREEQEWELSVEKKEWETRLKKRRRAEIMLWGVSENEDLVEDVIALPQTAVFRNYQAPPTIQSKGMGGVETISGTGIAKGSLAKKTVFGDDGATTVNGVNAANVPVTAKPNVEVKPGVDGVQGKRKRKRKRRTTGVPDDDSSSESSDSSSSDEGEAEAKSKPNGVTKQQGNGRSSSSDGESSSSSDSDSDSLGSSSDGDSDSDSE